MPDKQTTKTIPATPGSQSLTISIALSRNYGITPIEFHEFPTPEEAITLLNELNENAWVSIITTPKE